MASRSCRFGGRVDPLEVTGEESWGGGEEGGVVLHARRVCGPAESGRSFTRVELLMIPLGRFRSTLASDSHCY